jgi:isopenicillin N synthase-like dioxygenase
LTGGELRSTRHRARNASGRARLAYPFFFDPAFDARVEPLPGREHALDDAVERWDKVGVRASVGTYGDYLQRKLARVFPTLGREVL